MSIELCVFGNASRRAGPTFGGFRSAYARIGSSRSSASPPAASILFVHADDLDGNALFEAACKTGLEGIVSKRRDMVYASGVLNRLDDPEYYFDWNSHGNNSIFNILAY